MYCKIALAALAVMIGSEFALTQQIPSTTTAAELWNPWTWFWPYAIASAEAYRDYYEKAQKATNELYQQIYKTNAFPLITGNWGASQTNQSGSGGQNNTSGNAAQPNQEGSNGQNTPSGNSAQSNPQGSNGQNNQGNATQQNQEDSTGQNGQGDSAKANQSSNEGNNEPAENQTPVEGSGTQVQGEVQGDGTADAEVNANAEKK